MRVTTRRLPSRVLAASIAAVLLGAACAAPRASDGPSAAPSEGPTAAVSGTAPASETPAVLPSASASPPPAPSAATDGPPVAALGAEGGDPVTAQLGTYTWGEGGSDAPWLRGAPITVGAGEPLTVTFEPALAPDEWHARLVDPEADGPAGAETLGQGTGVPLLTAPSPGRYTLALEVRVDGLGTAHYAWLLDVR